MHRNELEMLKRRFRSGSELWNLWRVDEHKPVKLPFSRFGAAFSSDPVSPILNLTGDSVDLSGYDLSDIDFSGSLFRKVNLSGANLTRAKLWRCEFEECVLDGAILEHADLGYTHWWETSLQHAEAEGAKVHGATFFSCSLHHADFTDADVSSAHFYDCDLSQVIFTASSRQSLSSTFLDCRLDHVDFTNRNILRSAFIACDLGTANILHTYADLISLDGHSIRKTAKYFREEGLSADAFARWLETSHEPAEVVRLFRRWASSAVGYHNVFLSYSHADRQVALLIADALDTRGIDCWMDKDQMYGGEQLDEAVRHAIDGAGRFVVLVSADSLRVGSYARLEIEYALQRESTTGGASYVVTVLLEPGILQSRQDDVVAALKRRVGIDFFPNLSIRDKTNALIALQKSCELTPALEGSSEDGRATQVPIKTTIERLTPRVKELLEHVKMRGSAEIPPHLQLHGIVISDYGGSYPVQVFGSVDGHEIYFRARHGMWTLKFGAWGTDFDTYSGPIPNGNEHTGEMEDSDVAAALANGIVRFRRAYVDRTARQDDD